jgi:cation:H+ antiporter
MMCAFVVWLLMVVRHARKHASASLESGDPVSPGKTIVAIVLGLGLLIVAAQFVVHGGKGVAEALGWSPFVVGAVVVAAATSTPELATTLIARMRGHHDVGLGNILGSNIFNVFFIASVAALIQPYGVKVPEILPSLIYEGKPPALLGDSQSLTVPGVPGVLVMCDRSK